MKSAETSFNFPSPFTLFKQILSNYLDSLSAYIQGGLSHLLQSRQKLRTPYFSIFLVISVEVMMHVLQILPLDGLNLIPQRGQSMVTSFDLESLITDV